MKKFTIIISSTLLLSVLFSCTGNKSESATAENAPAVLTDSAPAKNSESAKAAVPAMSVMELFMKMPVQYMVPFKVDMDYNAKERKAMISKKDTINGYLKLEDKGAYTFRGYTELRTWKMSDGTTIVGVSVLEEDEESAPQQHIVFWKLVNNDWTDITSTIYGEMDPTEIKSVYKEKVNAVLVNPMTGETHMTIQFPQGEYTAMEVYFEDNTNGKQVKVAEYQFEDDRFILKL
jgi:hypothetical protein